MGMKALLQGIKERIKITIGERTKEATPPKIFGVNGMKNRIVVSKESRVNSILLKELSF